MSEACQRPSNGQAELSEVVNYPPRAKDICGETDALFILIEYDVVAEAKLLGAVKMH